MSDTSYNGRRRKLNFLCDNLEEFSTIPQMFLSDILYVIESKKQFVIMAVSDTFYNCRGKKLVIATVLWDGVVFGASHKIQQIQQPDLPSEYSCRIRPSIPATSGQEFCDIRPATMSVSDSAAEQGRII